MVEITIDRKTFIGGSDISAVMGMSRWKTPLMLWAEKTGKVEPKDLSDNEAVELGSELEDFVAKKFERKTGLKVRRAPKIYIHKDHDIFRCQVDRLIEGIDELLEVKTCSAWLEKEWAGEEIPQEYILQVMWQLGITGRSKGYIAVLIGGQKFRYKEIEFDQEIFDNMVKAALDFWQMVEDGTPPIAVDKDNDFLVEVHPESNEEIQDAEELNDAIALRQETIMHMDNLRKQKEDCEAKIKQRIGDALGVRTSQYTVTWKKQARVSVDTKKLKEDGVYEKYKQVSETRYFRVRKESEDGNGSTGEE